MKKKFIFFLIIFLFLLTLANFTLAESCVVDSDCGTNAQCVEGKCVSKTLEVTYPQIFGKELTDKNSSGTLPIYINYIFTLSVALIGLIIFGVLIYNGILYLTSAGDPAQINNAKNGIINAFLGGLLLLSSVLIFDTINPQLKILELNELISLEAVPLSPGVYICNINYDKIPEVDISRILNSYIMAGTVYEEGTPGREKQIQEQREAAKKLEGIVRKYCILANSSRNLEFKVTENKLAFIIPSISFDPDKNERKANYEFGFILHQKERWGGQCIYYPNVNVAEPEAPETTIYHQLFPPSVQELPFTAYSITVFQKPSVKPVGEGVTLYQHGHYNKNNQNATTTEGLQKSFKPGLDSNREKDIKKVNKEKLEKLADNSRSISFSPEGSYFALLFEKDNFQGKCSLVKKNKSWLPDVLESLNTLSSPYNPSPCYDDTDERFCRLYLGSMIVIEGTVL